VTSQYLTFEINPTCNLAQLHPKCPINDPDRYGFGETEHALTDDLIVTFWLWCRGQGFDGIILWHLYNEPTLALTRIRTLQKRMQAIEPSQRFHLWTNAPKSLSLKGFDHVQLTDYREVRPDALDNRRASVTGEGKPYAKVTPSGSCGRGAGWELIIDHHGNWILCCNDWRCEESVGNIFNEDWPVLLARYEQKARIVWNDEASYQALPRLCRACIDVNPKLHRTARMPKGVAP
jgi:hypothetical protein